MEVTALCSGYVLETIDMADLMKQVLMCRTGTYWAPRVVPHAHCLSRSLGVLLSVAGRGHDTIYRRRSGPFPAPPIALYW